MKWRLRGGRQVPPSDSAPVSGDATHAGVPIIAGDTVTIPPTNIAGADPTTNASADTGAAAATETQAQHRRVVKSATIISLGTLLGSVMGFVRSETINVLFYGDASGAFTLALRPIQQVSDLLVGGSVSGALIPTFVDYSEADKREELRRIYSTVANLVALVM
ncbi:MAG: hypothetical protein ACRDHE_08195, partial [Ktedonobacterales bacterium]